VIFRALAILKLKRAGYRDVPLDVWWSAATHLANKDIRKVRVLEKKPGDAWIIYYSKPYRVHTMNHSLLRDMDQYAVMGYVHNLSMALIEAAK
jgi:hypothetical protein